MKLSSTLVSRILLVRHIGEITTTDSGISGAVGDTIFHAKYPEIVSVRLRCGKIWSELVLDLRGSEEPVRIGGLRRNLATTLYSYLLEQSLRDLVNQACMALNELLQRPHYLSHRDWKTWVDIYQFALDRIPDDHGQLSVTDTFRTNIRRLRAALTSGDGLRAERNARFTARELDLHRAWFDQVERYPLTRRQRTAIVCNEDNTLVVAGAGTGKTSTIVAKVGYLLRKNLARPEEILLLAFAHKARDEMAERIASKFNVPVEIRTFHSLGLDILAKSNGTKPSLTRLSEDSEMLRETIEGYLAQAFNDPQCQVILRRFCLQYRYPRRSEFDCKTANEYHRYMAGQGIRTIRGERVKSFGEMVIADFLTAHGIPYRYEAPYEIDTATPEHRQYMPDFWLPEHKIYIEYFGTDRQGKTARYINGTEYRAGMDWKRATHRKYGTALLELFAYDLFEGQLEQRLEQQLRASGIRMEPITGLDLHKALNEGGELKRVADLLGSFLGMYKANNWTLAEIRRRAEAAGESARSLAFINVFEAILSRYTRDLSAAREIDFHDMIAMATAVVQAGQYQSPFRYIIVDEFQDISRGRAQLLQALLAQQPDRRLFCVGDDWQSIYRFTGSDVGIMVQFADHFGYTQRVDLNTAFRFSREILDVSSKFIVQNPQQLRKELTAGGAMGSPAVTIISEASDAPEGSGLGRALRRIQTQQGEKPASVMLLGRYRFSLPRNVIEPLRSQFPALEIVARTVHAAKGLEADYVVVLGMTAGRYGFPTEVADDPVINLVLAAGGDFPNAEERRLFYVAITRARQGVYLVTPDASRSSFIVELEGALYRGLVESDGPALQVPCLVCGGGHFIKRRGEHGVLWGCSNYPYCDGKGTKCPRCQDGVFVRGGQKYVCSNKNCPEEAEACPRCNDGFLRLRHSEHGAFLGCSNWHPEGSSCGYKRDIRRR